MSNRYPIRDGDTVIGHVKFLAACRDCHPWTPVAFDDPESVHTWIGEHLEEHPDHHVETGVRTQLDTPPTPPHHSEPMMRHAWRWYWVEDGLLISPVERAPLPRNGKLRDVHVFPSAALMNHALQGRWLEHTPEDITAKGYALTVGRAYPPFTHDGNIDASFGSTVVGRYKAATIFTTQPVHAESYKMPVVPATDLPTLQDAERT